MKIALTGTPGTGKSTVAPLVDAGFGIVDLNEVIKEGYNLGADPERGSLIADLDRLDGYVESLEGDYIIEGHVAHLLPVDKIVVLRTAPAVLRQRLERRGWSQAKITENLEAEALDVILVEALEASGGRGRPGEVYEIDATGMPAEQVAEAVRQIIRGTDNYKPGGVDFSEELFL
ncbi:MAG: putative kinase [Methanocella sp. PtaU1.Bin125]|nr:MAG: putative kinase [Methanocella sp. PtaU1.Bin125]